MLLHLSPGNLNKIHKIKFYVNKGMHDKKIADGTKNTHSSKTTGIGTSKEYRIHWSLDKIF